MSPATQILKDGLGKALSKNFCAVGFCVFDLLEGLGIGRQRVGILEPEAPNWSGENLGDVWQAGLGCTYQVGAHLGTLALSHFGSHHLLPGPCTGGGLMWAALALPLLRDPFSFGSLWRICGLRAVPMGKLQFEEQREGEWRDREQREDRKETEAKGRTMPWPVWFVQWLQC